MPMVSVFDEAGNGVENGVPQWLGRTARFVQSSVYRWQCAHPYVRVRVCPPVSVVSRSVVRPSVRPRASPSRPPACLLPLSCRRERPRPRAGHRRSIIIISKAARRLRRTRHHHLRCSLTKHCPPHTSISY